MSNGTVTALIDVIEHLADDDREKQMSGEHGFGENRLTLTSFILIALELNHLICRNELDHVVVIHKAIGNQTFSNDLTESSILFDELDTELIQNSRGDCIHNILDGLLFSLLRNIHLVKKGHGTRGENTTNLSCLIGTSAIILFSLLSGNDVIIAHSLIQYVDGNDVLIVDPFQIGTSDTLEGLTMRSGMIGINGGIGIHH